MLISIDTALAGVVEAAINWLPGAVKLHAWLQFLVFGPILRRVYRRFIAYQPDWTVCLFDEQFLYHHAALLLAHSRQTPASLRPRELALAWDEQLGPASPAVRERRIEELTLAAGDFLDWLELELQDHPLFRHKL